MTIQSDVTDLTVQTTALLAVFLQQQVNVDARIAAAVLASQSAAQIPLVQLSTNFINSQAMLINYIGQRP